MVNKLELPAKTKVVRAHLQVANLEQTLVS
jgi:hypothetical protein